MSKQKTEKRKIVYTNAKEVADKQKGGFINPCLKLPPNLPTFSFSQAGVFKFSIIPFVAKKGNPMADEGQIHYERTYYQHRLGPDNSVPYTCPAMTFGKKCPVCEQAAKLKRDGVDKEALKIFEPKKRQIYLIDLHDPKVPGRNLHIFETGYWKVFGQMLSDKIDASEEDSPYRNFFHMEGGQILAVKATQQSWKGGTFFGPTNIEMYPRKNDYPESILDEVPCLDDLIAETPYDKLKELLDSGGTADVEDAPKASKTASTTEEEEEAQEEPTPKKTAKKGKEKTAKELGLKVGDLVNHDGVECEIAKISGDGTSLTLTDPDGDRLMGIAPSDVELIEGPDSEDMEDLDDEEETPAPKKAGKKPAKAEIEDDDEEIEEPSDLEDDDDDLDDLEEDDDLEDLVDLEEEEEEPVAKKKPTKKK